MKSKLIQIARKGKKKYGMPLIKPIGSVRQLTLKLGSNTDGMGGHIE